MEQKNEALKSCSHNAESSNFKPSFYFRLNGRRWMAYMQAEVPKFKKKLLKGLHENIQVFLIEE